MRSCVLLIGIGLLFFSLEITQASFRIDCTKFVFAPKCRGVAAKRGSPFAASTDSVSFDGRRQRLDTLSAGDLIRRSSSLLKLRSRPNPSLTSDESRRTIDRSRNDYFRSRRDISESLDHFRTKDDTKDVGQEGQSQSSPITAPRTIRGSSFNRQ